MILEDPKLLIEDELKQLQEEGYIISDVADSYNWYLLNKPTLNWKDTLHFYNFYFNNLQKDPNFKYNEPSEINEIKSYSKFKSYNNQKFSEEAIYEKIYGALLGRAAGCMLGKPVEGWKREDILEYLSKVGESSLTYYFPFVEGYENKIRTEEFFRSILNKAVRDDDLDYPIIGLKILEEYGTEFSTRNVGKIWLENLPFGLVYTAERASYRNLVNSLIPPETARFINPYREWIGAQIRGDIFGWISPSDPIKAAYLAYKDASLSHVKNGIYGEMYISALLSLAYIIDEPPELIKESLNFIPETSRFHEAISFVLELYERRIDFEAAWEEVNKKFGKYHFVHTINNACFVVLALLYGEKNFERTVCLAVECGCDTDCNGATAGSILGLLLGYKNLPERWVSPLNDTLESLVPGFQRVRISDLARRITNLIS